MYIRAKGKNHLNVKQLMDDLNVVHSCKGYYLAIKKNEVLIHMNLENIMLKEVNHKRPQLI